MLQSSRRIVLRATAAARAGAVALPASRSLASIALAASPASALSRSQHVMPVALAAAVHAKQALPSTVRRAFSSAASGETIDVPVPSMGDSISEGTVVEWLKQPGDAVEMDEVVVVLETDKVSVDVRAPSAGKLAKHLAAIDDNVLVGAPLFQLVQGESDSASTSSEASTSESESSSSTTDKSTESSSTASNATTAASSSEPETVNVPSMGDSISEGTIVHWAKSVGDSVEVDDVVVVIETDKVSVDVRAPKAGVLHDVLAKVDDVVTIGAPLFQLLAGASTSNKKKPAEEKTDVAPAKKSETKETKTSETKPSTPAQEKKSEPSSSNDSNTHPLLLSPTRATRREKMSRMRLRTAERLKESQNTSASLTTFQEVDMTRLLALRSEYKDAFAATHGVKLGFMSAFVKASASALLAVPAVNAMIDDAHQEIVYRDFVDMSVAVSTPKGLVTPVLRNTESMGFADIEKGLAELAERARAGKLTLDEMTGGNFTISNGGVFGSLMGTPIINLPQSAILGMHATKLRPVVVDGAIVARPMMYLALTYDHRLIDGREAVTCLKSIADKIEHPERLLLDL